MASLLTADVCSHSPFEAAFAKLLKYSRSEEGIIKGSCPQPNQWVSMSAFEALLVSF